MPLDSNGIWQYTETEAASLASDMLNRLSSSVSDVVEDLDTRVSATEANDASWTALPLAAGWAVGTGWLGLAYRKIKGTVELGGCFLIRPSGGSAQAVAPGTPITIATLPAGYRPSTASSVVGAGGIAANGLYGYAAWWILPDGKVQVVPHIGAGSIVAGGPAVANNVHLGAGVRFVAA